MWLRSVYMTKGHHHGHCMTFSLFCKKNDFMMNVEYIEKKPFLSNFFLNVVSDTKFRFYSSEERKREREITGTK